MGASPLALTLNLILAGQLHNPSIARSSLSPLAITPLYYHARARLLDQRQSSRSIPGMRVLEQQLVQRNAVERRGNLGR